MTIIDYPTSTPERYKKLGFNAENSKAWYHVNHTQQYIELRFLSKYNYNDDYEVVTAKVYGLPRGGSFTHTREGDRLFKNRMKAIKKCL